MECYVYSYEKITITEIYIRVGLSRSTTLCMCATPEAEHQDLFQKQEPWILGEQGS